MKSKSLCEHTNIAEGPPEKCLDCGKVLLESETFEGRLIRRIEAAQEIVKRFIVAQGPHLSDSWRDGFIKELGLIEDEMGWVKVPMQPVPPVRTRSDWVVIWEVAGKDHYAKTFPDQAEAYAFYERQSGQGCKTYMSRVIEDAVAEDRTTPTPVGPNQWDRRFLDLAKHFSMWSKDPSTKVGCVIVGPDREIRSTGFNGFPRGVADDARLFDREQKYPLICHGEENAILHAARLGVALRGCICYCTWPPCTRCCRALIQVGISEVVYPAGLTIPDRWEADFKLSTDLLKEAGITVRTV